MRPYRLQKPLDIKNLEEGLLEYFRLLAENALKDIYPDSERDTPANSRSFELEMV